MYKLTTYFFFFYETVIRTANLISLCLNSFFVSPLHGVYKALNVMFSS